MKPIESPLTKDYGLPMPNRYPPIPKISQPKQLMIMKDREEL